MSRIRRERQAQRSSKPGFWRVVFFDARKHWTKILAVLGVSSLLDLIREFGRLKLMEWVYGRFGGFGQWLLVYPFAVLTIALTAVILVLMGVAIWESHMLEDSFILDPTGNPYPARKLSGNWTAGFCTSGVICIALIAYGAYEYYLSRPQALLDKYPLGYVVFDLDRANSVFPYQSRSILDKYDIDWSVVTVKDTAPNRIELRLPELLRKSDGKRLFSHAVTGGPKRVGNLGGMFYDDLVAWGEILAIRPNGTVFLVGFDRAPKPPPRS